MIFKISLNEMIVLQGGYEDFVLGVNKFVVQIGTQNVQACIRDKKHPIQKPTLIPYEPIYLHCSHCDPPTPGDALRWTSRKEPTPATTTTKRLETVLWNSKALRPTALATKAIGPKLCSRPAEAFQLVKKTFNRRTSNLLFRPATGFPAAKRP